MNIDVYTRWSLCNEMLGLNNSRNFGGNLGVMVKDRLDMHKYSFIMHKYTVCREGSRALEEDNMMSDGKQQRKAEERV
ncbi:hypothetical protein AGMMS49983_20410 [Clostridia bacterium]|nr:hypothetical protein AGMMS49983_20410 [Clostridia bacterium]